jgi:hypothetical protein
MTPARHSPLYGPDEPASGGGTGGGGSFLKTGWRVGHQGRDQMFYEERHRWSWRRINVSGEMLTGPAHHVIYFASAEQWQHYPAWAQGRRDEIIGRIKSEFRPPDYEYFEGGQVPPAGPSGMPPARPLKGASFPMILFMLGIAFYMIWTTKGALESGSVSFHGRYGMNVTSSREEQPTRFWFTISFISAIGIGAGSFGLWLASSSFRSR